jgi:cytochrome P450
VVMETSRAAARNASRERAAAPAPSLVPLRVQPQPRPANRIVFVSRFLRNPLLVIPRSAYEEDIVPYDRGSVPFAWVTEPGLIKTILLDEHEKFGKRMQIQVLGPLLGNGILTSEGPEWKWQRQTSAPMFRRQDLGNFVPIFVRAARQVVERWRRAGTGVRHQIERDMTRATFDVICATLLPSGDASVGATVEASTDRFQRSGAWHRLYIIGNVPAWMPQPGRRAMRAATRSLRSAVADLVRARRNAASAPDDLMHRLMQAHDPDTGAPMNEEQLIDNLLTFYLAGHETTAMALTWTLYLLALSPEWTGALKSEVARVTSGTPVTAEHIDKLVLTQQVLKESMRVYPPVPMLSRQAIADITIGGHAIKAGTSIVMPIYAIHRHHKRWRDPDVFDPTRFAPENEAGISRYQYLPFGAGPRICIGMAFAMIEATAMLATLLQSVAFEPVAGHEPTPIARVTLHPKGGMPLKVWVE